MAEVLLPPKPVTIDKANGSASNGAPLPKFAASDIILPPPDIKTIIAKTAVHVARSTTREQFEERLRESRREDPKFSFLIPTDPYHAYYKDRVQRVLAGEVEEEAPGATNETAMQVDKPAAPVDEGEEPPRMNYALVLPPISAMDIDLMKLTALFTAQRGTQFLASLSVKEGRNHQFDFLNPASMLYGTFNAMLEQYRRILLPPPEELEKVREAVEPDGKWQRLAKIRRHAKWERIQREKQKQKDDDKEAERIAFAEIDWHEFAIVQTIEFTAADANTELPVPMTIEQMEARALEEKRMTAMVMVDTAEEFERAKEAATVAMQQQEEEQRRRIAEQEDEIREQLRMEEVQAKNIEGAGPMKIRHDYVPKTLVEKAKKTQMTTCQVCGQQIPANELEEHIRIELLDPRWKSQRAEIESRRSQAKELQRGADPAAALRKLARKRPDMFGAEETEELRRKEEEAELARRKEREKVVWDGHTASKVGTMDKYQTNVNLEEQIAAIHRSKGLAQTESAAIGPGIGPAITPAPIFPQSVPASLPKNPTLMAESYTGTAASSGAPSAPANIFNLAPGQQQPVVLPPLHYQGLASSQPFGYAPPPPGMRVGTPGGKAGTVRSADEMLEGDMTGGPVMKRPRVGRMPDGQLYPEDTWLSYHQDPITIHVRLPLHADKPEWKLDGSVVAIPDVSLSAIVSTLRDKLIAQLGSKVPVSRIKLSMGHVTLTNSKSLASYNIMDGEEIAFELRDPKKK